MNALVSKLILTIKNTFQAAIGCFIQALNKYPEKSPIRTSILMELAESLVTLNLKFEAVAYYEQALDTVEDKTRKLMFMKNLVNLLIDCGIIYYYYFSLVYYIPFSPLPD